MKSANLYYHVAVSPVNVLFAQVESQITLEQLHARNARMASVLLYSLTMSSLGNVIDAKKI